MRNKRPHRAHTLHHQIQKYEAHNTRCHSISCCGISKRGFLYQAWTRLKAGKFIPSEQTLFDTWSQTNQFFSSRMPYYFPSSLRAVRVQPLLLIHNIHASTRLLASNVGCSRALGDCHVQQHPQTRFGCISCLLSAQWRALFSDHEGNPICHPFHLIMSIGVFFSFCVQS